MESIQQLSSTEKNLFLFSLPVLNKNMEFFTIRFYQYLLETESGSLFKNTRFEKQHKMFGESLNLILTSLSDPEMLDKVIQKHSLNHVKYGVKKEHIQDFIRSFMNALKETLTENTDKQLFKIWLNVVTELMKIFESNL